MFLLRRQPSRHIFQYLFQVNLTLHEVCQALLRLRCSSRNQLFHLLFYLWCLVDIFCPIQNLSRHFRKDFQQFHWRAAVNQRQRQVIVQVPVSPNEFSQCPVIECQFPALDVIENLRQFCIFPSTSSNSFSCLVGDMPMSANTVRIAVTSGVSS